MIDVQRSNGIVWMPHLFQEGWGVAWPDAAPCLHLQLLSILSAETGVPERKLIKKIDRAQKRDEQQALTARKTFAQFERWAGCTATLWPMESVADVIEAIDAGRPVLWIANCHNLEPYSIYDVRVRPPSETGSAHTALVIGYDTAGYLIIRDSRPRYWSDGLQLVDCSKLNDENIRKDKLFAVELKPNSH